MGLRSIAVTSVPSSKGAHKGCGEADCTTYQPIVRADAGISAPTIKKASKICG